MFIFHSYAKATPRRRKHITDSWHFQCTCLRQSNLLTTKGPFDLASFKLPRCQDPTENGSFLGAIICPACLGSAEKNYSSLDTRWRFTYEDIDNDIGFLLPKKPFQDGSQWICQKCGHFCPSKNAEDICSRLLGRARNTCKSQISQPHAYIHGLDV